MKKIEKIKNLEVARVLLIQAANMIEIARDKILEVDPDAGLEHQFALHCVTNLTRSVITMQNQLEGRK